MKRTKQSTFARRERQEKGTGFAPVGGAQFTPGPWYPHLAKADHCLSSSVWGAEPGNQVAVIGRKSLQTMNANATLIAAAPAMYEALQALLALIGDEDLPDNGELSGASICDFARSALAQAEGREG